MKKVTFRTDFLFPDTDFITGMGSAINIAGNYFSYATSANEDIADEKALRSDWGVIGQDLSKSLAEETPNSKKELSECK
jgi:hypothetical protein